MAIVENLTPISPDTKFFPNRKFPQNPVNPIFGHYYFKKTIISGE
jgi:hypothetical protein